MAPSESKSNPPASAFTAGGMFSARVSVIVAQGSQSTGRGQPARRGSQNEHYFTSHSSSRLGCQAATFFAFGKQIDKGEVSHPFGRKLVHASDHAVREAMPLAEQLCDLLADNGCCTRFDVAASLGDIHRVNGIPQAFPDSFLTLLGNG